MNIAIRITIGALVMAVGFWMIAVLSPPDGGGGSLVALAVLTAGALMSGFAALDAFDHE